MSPPSMKAPSQSASGRISASVASLPASPPYAPITARASASWLAYGLYAFERGHPGDSLAGFQLQGAERRFQRWEGRPDRPLDLRGADLAARRWTAANSPTAISATPGSTARTCRGRCWIGACWIGCRRRGWI
jgi:hypothetical protein